MSPLGEFILQASTMPWRDGVHDCSAWPARWACVPLPDYASMEQAEALIDEAGGLIPLWERIGATRIERIAVEDAQPGNIGVISLPDRRDGKAREVGAIFTGERWAFVPLQGGVCCVKTTPLAAWRCMCRNS